MDSLMNQNGNVTKIKIKDLLITSTQWFDMKFQPLH